MPLLICSQFSWLCQDPQGLLPGQLYLPTSSELWQTLPPSHSFWLYGRSLYRVILQKLKYDRISPPTSHRSLSGSPVPTGCSWRRIKEALCNLEPPSLAFNLLSCCPSHKLGCLRHLSHPQQALIIFQDLALADHHPIGNPAQCPVCPEDWLFFSDAPSQYPIRYGCHGNCML